VRDHREHGLDDRVIEITQPRDRSNFKDVELTFRSQDLVANVHANHSTDYNVMDLIEGISGKRE
jgi:hypothetical protein